MVYYLVPFEDDGVAEKLGFNACPKYLDLLGVARGMLPAPLQSMDGVVVEWRQRYYVIRTEAQNTKLEAQPDVIRLDKNTSLSSLAGIGINTSGIDSSTATRATKDGLITQFLLGKTAQLSEVL